MLRRGVQVLPLCAGAAAGGCGRGWHRTAPLLPALTSRPHTHTQRTRTCTPAPSWWAGVRRRGLATGPAVALPREGPPAEGSEAARLPDPDAAAAAVAAMPTPEPILPTTTPPSPPLAEAAAGTTAGAIAGGAAGQGQGQGSAPPPPTTSTAPTTSAEDDSFLYWLARERVAKNVASCARDHLANERTFLAWSKTGLVFIGAGVGLHQFQDVFDHASMVPASLLFFTCGAGFLAYSTRRYFTVMRDLELGLFRPNKRGVIAIVVLSSMLTCCALGIILEMVI